MGTEQGSEEKKLVAFHGNPDTKEFYLKRVREHAAVGEIVQEQGPFWLHDCGNALVCTTHGSNYADYETLLGIPEILARLEDHIFEELALNKAEEWPEQFLSAIPVGADLSGVMSQFIQWLLIDPEDGVIKFVQTEDQRQAVRQAARLYEEETTKVSEMAIRIVVHAAAYSSGEAVKTAYAAIGAAGYATNHIVYAADNAEVILVVVSKADHAVAYATYFAVVAAAAAVWAASKAVDYITLAAASRISESALAVADIVYWASRGTCYHAHTAKKERFYYSRQAEKLLELLRATPIVEAA